MPDRPPAVHPEDFATDIGVVCGHGLRACRRLGFKSLRTWVDNSEVLKWKRLANEAGNSNIPMNVMERTRYRRKYYGGGSETEASEDKDKDSDRGKKRGMRERLFTMIIEGYSVSYTKISLFLIILLFISKHFFCTVYRTYCGRVRYHVPGYRTRVLHNNVVCVVLSI